MDDGYGCAALGWAGWGAESGLGWALAREKKRMGRCKRTRCQSTESPHRIRILLPLAWVKNMKNEKLWAGKIAAILSRIPKPEVHLYIIQDILNPIFLLTYEDINQFML